MIFYFLIIVALFLIFFEIYCSKKNKKYYLENKNSARWNKIYKWRWLIGIVFLPLSLIEYPMFGTSNTVVGFPLIIAAFDEAGRDYVGVITVPFAIVNALIWYFTIHIILCIWSKYR